MKKRNLIILIASIAIIVIGFLFVFFNSNIMPSINYNRALEAYHQKNYKDASAYLANINYENSEDLYLETAKLYLDNTDEDCEEVFNFINSKYRPEDHFDAYYINILLKNGNTEEAASLLSKLSKEERKEIPHKCNEWLLDATIDKSVDTLERIYDEIKECKKESSYELIDEVYLTVCQYLYDSYGELIEAYPYKTPEKLYNICSIARFLNNKLSEDELKKVIPNNAWSFIDINGFVNFGFTLYGPNHTLIVCDEDGNIIKEGKWKIDDDELCELDQRSIYDDERYTVYKLTDNLYLFDASISGSTSIRVKR